MRIAAFRCANRPQIWIPEKKYYQKDTSHAQNRQQGAEIEKKVLKCALMRIAAFRCVRRPQIWTPRQKYYQKMYSHIHYRLQKPEKHFWLFQLARFFQKKA